MSYITQHIPSLYNSIISATTSLSLPLYSLLRSCVFCHNILKEIAEWLMVKCSSSNNNEIICFHCEALFVLDQWAENGTIKWQSPSNKKKYKSKKILNKIKTQCFKILLAKIWIGLKIKNGTNKLCHYDLSCRSRSICIVNRFFYVFVRSWYFITC
jgi:hypothetical protein